MKRLALFLKLVLTACVLFSLAQTANAQSIDGTLGWQSAHSITDYYSSAGAACHAQWQYYMGGHVDSRYIGYNADVGNPNRVECRWTQYQYLCPQETGGGINSCWTIFPAWAELKCQSGYVPVQGRCDKDPTPERPCNGNNGSSRNPKVGHPIILSSCSKVLQSADYSSGDGDFVISRSYRSLQFGRNVSFFKPLQWGLRGAGNSTSCTNSSSPDSRDRPLRRTPSSRSSRRMVVHLTLSCSRAALGFRTRQPVHSMHQQI